MKKVLLIGGGGTLGEYTGAELLRLGHAVDVLCLEEKTSDNGRLTYFRQNADLSFLTSFLEHRTYDAIVNFLHYKNPADYPAVHRLLTAKTGQLVFLSSYRVYANEQVPITEEAPQLIETVKDPAFLATETYAVSKSESERYIVRESGTENWTIVRPVISFSARRLDVVTVSDRQILERTARGEVIPLPAAAKHLTAGLDWAGNSGKLMAHLLFKKEALGEAFTVSTAQNLTWGEVAAIYEETVGAKFRWVDTESFMDAFPYLRKSPWILIYDRLFDRRIDNTKIQMVTGLTAGDFSTIKAGILKELDNIAAQGSL